MLAVGFQDLALEEIVSFTVPANLRSRRVMERIGMTRSPADDYDHPAIPEGHPLRRHVLYRAGDPWNRRRIGDPIQSSTIRRTPATGSAPPAGVETASIPCDAHENS